MKQTATHTNNPGFKTISEILRENEQSIDVFQAFGIDHTQIHRTLYEVCETRGIELHLLIECLKAVGS